MPNSLSYKLKTIIIIFIFTILAVVLHQFAPDPKNEGIPLSVFYKIGFFGPMIMLDLLLTFSLMVYVLLFMSQSAKITLNINLGFQYGFSFSVLWFLGFLEGSLLFGTSIKHDILHGISDFIPIILMFSFLGKIYNKSKKHDKYLTAFNLSAIFMIVVFHIIGRYFLYIVLAIDSPICCKPIPLFFWTVGIGFAIGLIYSNVSIFMMHFTPLKKALVFSIITFGTDWFLFYTFVTIIQEVNLLETFVRPIIDILFVFFSIYLYEIFFQKKYEVHWNLIKIGGRKRFKENNQINIC